MTCRCKGSANPLHQQVGGAAESQGQGVNHGFALAGAVCKSTLHLQVTKLGLPPAPASRRCC